MKKYEERIIEYADILYPDKLREIKNPPLRLYTKGNIELLNSIGIAIVGSRTNTQYGEKMCKTFTSIELKEKFNQLVIDVFETDKNENSLEMDNDYTDI